MLFLSCCCRVKHFLLPPCSQDSHMESQLGFLQTQAASKWRRNSLYASACTCYLLLNSSPALFSYLLAIAAEACRIVRQC
jgi:hypothetical protein